MVVPLSPHLPGLTALELLLAVQQTGSLSAAGARTGTSQQAASARIRAVEAQVGLPLLVRSPRGSVLSPAGRLVAQWAEAVLDAAQELDAGIASLRAGRTATLRLAASLTTAEHLVPRWLVALRAAQSAAGRVPTSVELVSANSDAVVAAVATASADLGFVEGPDAPAGVRSRVVGRDRLIVVVAPGHPWARRRTALSAAVLAGTALVSREAGSGTREALVRALVGHRSAEPALVAASSAEVRTAIAAGVAPGALSTLAVADDLALGRLVAVAVAGVNLSRSLRAVWATGTEPPAGPARELVALAARGQAVTGRRRRP
jgi:DNA-binding transcriptional LysR family regulator